MVVNSEKGKNTLYKLLSYILFPICVFRLYLGLASRPLKATSLLRIYDTAHSSSIKKESTTYITLVQCKVSCIVGRKSEKKKNGQKLIYF